MPPARSAPNTLEELRQRLEALLTEKKVPSAGIALVFEGRVRFPSAAKYVPEQGIGWAFLLKTDDSDAMKKMQKVVVEFLMRGRPRPPLPADFGIGQKGHNEESLVRGKKEDRTLRAGVFLDQTHEASDDPARD